MLFRRTREVEARRDRSQHPAHTVTLFRVHLSRLSIKASALGAAEFLASSMIPFCLARRPASARATVTRPVRSAAGCVGASAVGRRSGRGRVSRSHFMAGGCELTHKATPGCPPTTKFDGGSQTASRIFLPERGDAAGSSSELYIGSGPPRLYVWTTGQNPTAGRICNLQSLIASSHDCITLARVVSSPTDLGKPPRRPGQRNSWIQSSHGSQLEAQPVSYAVGSSQDQLAHGAFIYQVAPTT